MSDKSAEKVFGELLAYRAILRGEQPGAPAGDALQDALEGLRIVVAAMGATPSSDWRPLYEAERRVIQAARAEGAAQFVDYLQHKYQIHVEPLLREFVARSPSSGTEAR